MTLQLHYVMDKQAVKRGHILAVEGRPCMGMYFILEGQVWWQPVLLASTCYLHPRSNRPMWPVAGAASWLHHSVHAIGYLGAALHGHTSHDGRAAVIW